MAGAARPCVFCQIARSSTSTPLLYTDDRVAAFPDINPSAFSANSLLSRLVCLRSRHLVKDLVEAATRLYKSRKHYLVISIQHISTVNDLQRRTEDYQLVSHMLKVGQTLLHKDAPGATLYRFGFHQPPFNSVNHLHLHCLALPFIPSFNRWRHVKYMSLGPLGGFIEAEKLLERIKPLAEVHT